MTKKLFISTILIAFLSGNLLSESIEEIIVTASKKEENIQDVPMSVQAIGAAELDKKNIKTLEDISSVSPAVTFNNVGPGKSHQKQLLLYI